VLANAVLRFLQYYENGERKRGKVNWQLSNIVHIFPVPNTEKLLKRMTSFDILFYRGQVPPHFLSPFVLSVPTRHHH
jgi:hypothetical protein